MSQPEVFQTGQSLAMQRLQQDCRRAVEHFQWTHTLAIELQEGLGRIRRQFDRLNASPAAVKDTVFLAEVNSIYNLGARIAEDLARLENCHGLDVWPLPEQYGLFMHALEDLTELLA